MVGFAVWWCCEVMHWQCCRRGFLGPPPRCRLQAWEGKRERRGEWEEEEGNKRGWVGNIFWKDLKRESRPLLQRNLETPARPEVTPFINTRSAASSRIFCLCVAQKKQTSKKKKKNHWAAIARTFALFLVTSVCLSLTEGEVSQDVRYPICLIRHLFLNRPHLHSLPRSIHKK